MFLDNKYAKWYFALVDKARVRELSGYFEKHHVIPGSMGGKRNKDNLVKLTTREHFVAHCLLARCVAKEHTSKMWNAVMVMAVNPSTSQRYANSRQIALAKQKVAERVKQTHTGLKKPKTLQHRQKLSAALKGRKIEEAACKNMAKAMRNLVWVNDGEKSFRVNKDVLDLKLQEGYLLGRAKGYMTEDLKNKMRNLTKNHWQTIKSNGHSGILKRV